jgi:hypothetical protein
VAASDDADWIERLDVFQHRGDRFGCAARASVPSGSAPASGPADATRAAAQARSTSAPGYSADDNTARDSSPGKQSANYNATNHEPTC